MAKAETKKQKPDSEPAGTPAVTPAGATTAEPPSEPETTAIVADPAVKSALLTAATSMSHQPAVYLPDPAAIEFVEPQQGEHASLPTLGANMMIAERVYVISAPGGPRRRANMSFGPVARELRWDELGPDPEETLEALRGDPLLKIDGRYEDRPATPEDDD